MKETKTCGICHRTYPPDQLMEFDGMFLCPECLNVHTTYCSHCGDRIWHQDNAGNHTVPLCLSCYNDHYTSCTECGRIIHNDSAYYEHYSDSPYCYQCFEELHQSERVIHDYYHKPTPIFYGKDSRFFGVELEVDDAGECEDNAESILNIGNRNAEHIYCKHDGSLDDGFEVVTHPMTLEYHLSSMPWESILSKLRSMGYLSHQANTCGFHIHVNRNSLGKTESEQDTCIARILYFFEKHWEELLKFSRRTPRQLERWAARYGYKEHPMDILDHAKKGTNSGRYSCINLQNDSTIEFRMFRGTLKYNTIIATLQLVNRVCDVAFCLTDEELKSMSWTTFVSACTEPELIQYLKERRLYVNEPVESEADV